MESKEFDSCVSKVMKKNGKTKGEATSFCKLSITNKTIVEKEAYEVIADKETNYLYFTKSKINASKEGKVLKDVEIFKVGTFNGVEFKKTALEKMVANFNYLKAFNILPNVPVRADHPGGFFSGGDVIDKVGGYIQDIRMKGNKIVADFRITSEDMYDKILEGTYISRSAEIGMYEDNKGQVFSPTLQGVAWVDLPAVEGLSPVFSFSKDNKNLIKLNNMETSEEEVVEVETPTTPEEAETVENPTEEAVVEEGGGSAPDTVETPETEEVEEAPTVEPTEEQAPESKKEFAKDYPNEFKQMQSMIDAKIDTFIDLLVTAGKITPALVSSEKEFMLSLSEPQLNSYKELKKAQPELVQLNNEQVEDNSSEQPESAEEVDEDKAADDFLAA
jgi:hypothetical protein